jgi:hypothetical protein|tara:strand:+ start:656 stop:841 length:186 start_codon:yes stop_codon:yes gene_type:complete
MGAAKHAAKVKAVVIAASLDMKSARKVEVALATGERLFHPAQLRVRPWMRVSVWWSTNFMT